MKTSTQLKALIRNLSKEKNIEAEIILRNYMMERFLERIALSQYKDNFILKGGMLIAAIVGLDTRTTMDLDATLKSQALNEVEITRIIKNILSVPVDDEVTMTFKNIEAIREEADYPGYRVAILALLDNTRQTLKIDITTGDFVTPREVEYTFSLMFEDRKIHIMAYNLETILAEKFETILIRGTANTRMRDFYDIYILTHTQPYNPDIFQTALLKTSEKRKTSHLITHPKSVIKSISTDVHMIDLWKRYQMKYTYAKDVSWSAVINSIEKLY